MLTANLTDKDSTVTSLPLRIRRCSYLPAGDIIKNTSLLGHFSFKFGIRIDKFVVFKAIGGLSPSISFVTTRFRSLESSTSHKTVLRKLEERERLASDCFWNAWL